MADPLAPLCIAFVGIDGAGKSAIAARLCELVRARLGYELELFSWRRFVTRDGAGETGATVAALHAVSTDCWFRGATVAPEFAGQLQDELRERFERALGSDGAAPPITGNDPRLLTAAFLAELCADVYLHETAVRAELAKGRGLVLDSYGIKPVAKLMRLATLAAPPEDPAGGLLEAAMPLVRHVFETRAQPDLCVHVDVDTGVAAARRMARGRFGPVEDLTLIGDNSLSGFVALQGALQEVYRTLAASLDWQTVANPPGGLEAAAEAVFAAAARLPCLADTAAAPE